MTGRSRLVASLLCAAAAAGALAACGDDDDEDTSARPETTSTINSDTLEKTLVSNISGTGGPDQPPEATGPEVTKVECPRSVPTGKRVSVDCNATGGNSLSGTVKVTFSDESGAAYSYKAELETGDGRKQTAEGTVSGK